MQSDRTAKSDFCPSLERLETRDNPTAYLVTAPGMGMPALVRVYDTASGGLVRELSPFGGFTGGAQVASGDLTGDGVPDIVAAAGPGGGPHVRAFDGTTFEEIANFFAYDQAFRGGVQVAVGDVDADGRADIVTGVGVGGGPHVKAFSGLNGALLSEFFPYDPAFRGGVQVAVGDLDADGRADIVTGVGVGGGPHVKAFSGTSGSLMTEFFPYNSAFRGGVQVAVGDVNGDGLADIVTGAGPGGGPHVRTYPSTGDGGVRASTDFFAYDAAFTGGVRVATADLDGDGMADVLTAAAPGGGPHLRGFGGISGANLGRDLFAYDAAFTGGVFVGSGGQRELVVQPDDLLIGAGVADLGALGVADLVAGGLVSDFSPSALYSFTVPVAVSARIDLTGLAADADVQLIRDLDNDGGVDGDDVIAESLREGVSNEMIISDLEPGRYVVRVNQFLGDTGFALRVSRAADEDGATDAGALGTSSLRRTGRVSPQSPQADFDFTLSAAADLTAVLSGLSNDADLYLQASDGGGRYTEVARSINSGIQTDRVSQRLTAGAYRATVRRYSGSTDFVLDLTATSAGEPGVDNLGTYAGGTVSRSGSVNGGSDAEDNYRFTLTARREMTLRLDGLSDDADLYLLSGMALDSATEVTRSVNSGSTADTLTRTLDAGTYYVSVRRFSGTPSYTLTLTSTGGGGGPPPTTPGSSRELGSGLVRADVAVGLALGRTLSAATLSAADGSNFRDLNQVRAGGAWAAGVTGRGVLVAVIDSGVNTAHRELVGSVVPAANQFDFVDNDRVPNDANGHGSHVAGTIAANRDGQGITGVAYDALILPVRALNENGRGSNAAIARAIDFAVANGATVINLSLGGSALDPVVQTAVQQAGTRGVVVVAASGNDGASAPGWPARLTATLTNVVAVGAVDGSNRVASFSNRAGSPILRRFVVGPGVAISSLARTGNATNTVMSGTSMSAPHVAGVAALIREANPNLTAAQVVDILVRSATVGPF